MKNSEKPEWYVSYRLTDGSHGEAMARKVAETSEPVKKWFEKMHQGSSVEKVEPEVVFKGDLSKCTEWTITVGGYGSFFFSGSPGEAEIMRQHKARKEHAVAIKRPASPLEIKAAREKEEPAPLLAKSTARHVGTVGRAKIL